MLKYCEYLGKQASHITKHCWGVRDGNINLNINLKKIILIV